MPDLGGRPPIYTPELAAAILARIADGESLRSICRSEGMPSRSVIYDWVLSDHNGFATQYARAREMQAHALVDDLAEIADDGSNDWMERNAAENPGWVANGEHIQRSRLRFDQRRWSASKILPKIYGDKIEHEHTGDVNMHRVLAEKPLTEDEWSTAHTDKKPDAP